VHFIPKIFLLKRFCYGQLTGLDGGQPGQSHSFVVDTSGTGGLGDVVLDIVLSGRSVPHQVEELGPNKYRVTYMPAQPGKYKVYVYFNGSEIRGKWCANVIWSAADLIICHSGSAFSMRVGSYRSRHHSSSRHNSELRTEHSEYKLCRDNHIDLFGLHY
jgi:hypothetical protein